MERVTFRVPFQQLEEVDLLVEQGEFPNRSEAIRTFIRDGLNEHGRGKTHAADRPWEKA